MFVVLQENCQHLSKESIQHCPKEPTNDDNQAIPKKLHHHTQAGLLEKLQQGERSHSPR